MKASLAIFSVVSALSCGAIAFAELSAPAKTVAGASNQFGLDLYGDLATSGDGNLFFSPYGLDTALAMASAGAKGQTADQINSVLHLNEPALVTGKALGEIDESLERVTAAGGERAFDLRIANGLWAQKGTEIDPAFADLVTTQYRAGIGSVDFAADDASREQARQAINSSVERQTDGKIKDLLAPGALGGNTRLVLTDAIYFKSNWQTPFAADQTHDDPFHLDAMHVQNVATMHLTGRFVYAENGGVQIVELPYRSGHVSMLVMLPSKADGIGDLEKSLTSKSLEGLIASMQTREVELSLPKFAFASHFSLASSLRSMGMENAFGPDADFSGISRDGRFALHDVIHQAVISVDENGTEAAAATGATMGINAMPAPTENVTFNADHPFVFVIRDNNSGAILFMGRLMNPGA